MNKHIALVPALAGIALMSTADASNLRIIGGSKVNIEQYPYMTGLVSRGQSTTQVFCGASVINSQWILTAAHCVVDTQANALDVVTGIDTLSSPEKGERIQASEIIIHPNYNNNTVLNDIALIKLSSPTSASVIRTATGKDANLFATNQPVSVAGWGNLSTQGQQFPNKLHAVDLQVSGFQSCSRAYGGLEQTHLCASVPGGGKDSCQGDSGGPLVARTGKESVLVGIVSFGDACASATHPGVYTKVSEYGDFIAQALSGTTTPVDFDNNEPDPIDVDPTPDPDDTTDEDSQTDDTPATADAITISQLYSFDNFGYSQYYSDSLIEIHNDSNTELSISNPHVFSAQDIVIEYEDCTFAPLQADEYCYVDLSWYRYDEKPVSAEFGVDVYDGSTIQYQSIVLQGDALEPVDAEDALDYTEADYYTNDVDQWEMDESEYIEGDQSLSSDLSNGENLFLIGQFNQDGDFELEFIYQLTGANGYIYINDVMTYELIASDEWQTATLVVPANASVRWEFRANNRTSTNRKVRLDGISVKSSTTEATVSQIDNGGGSNGMLSMLALTLMLISRRTRTRHVPISRSK